MNSGSQPEAPREAPEADALEQQIPVLPEGSEELDLGSLPADSPEADIIEQHTDVLPHGTGRGVTAEDAGLEAPEADLIEQAVAPPFGDEEDYPDAREEPF